jgi:hypothetical protein
LPTRNVISGGISHGRLKAFWTLADQASEVAGRSRGRSSKRFIHTSGEAIDLTIPEKFLLRADTLIE